MAFGGAGDGEITVDINANAEPGAKQVEDAFSDALAQAMNDPRVRKAVTSLVAGIIKELGKIPKTTNKAFDETVKQADRASGRMVTAFKKVGKAATDATKFPSGTNRSFNVLAEQIASMANNMEDLARATRVQRDLLKDLATSARTATRSQDQQNRDRLQAEAQVQRSVIGNQQLQAAALRASSANRVAALRAFSRQAIQIERSITRVFELTWKSAERAVRGFVNIAGTTLRGLGRTVSTIFSGLGRTVSTFATGANRALATIGRGITSSLGAVSRAISSALSRDERAYQTSMSRRERALTSSLSRQAQAQQRFQAQQQSGILGGLGIAGAAGGLSIGALLTSGFTRAGQEESLELQFTTLLQDGPKATAMLQRISDYARTTRFDFTEVAGSVAQLTGAFGDVEKAFRTVNFLGDIVSLTGGGTTQFGAARLAFAQIAASGRLEGDELRQILEAVPGVPLARILADKFYGGDQAAFQEARRNGELGGVITAEAFFEAFEEGANQAFPELEGFSQRVGQSLGGLADNLRENFAIFGAEIIGLVEGPLKRGMGALNQFLSAAGGFISGSMFNQERGPNPFAQLAATDPNAEVNIADLPPAAQEILRSQFGFIDSSFVSAEDAAEIWENFTPPAETNERLKQFRDSLGDAAKAIGGVLALAGGFKILRLALIALTSPLGLTVLAAGGLGALFGRIRDSSLRLRGALAGLKPAFAGLGEAVRGLLEFVGGIASSAIFGNQNFFKSLGDRVAGFVSSLRRGIISLTNWVKMFEFFLRIGEGGRFLADTLQDIGRAIGDFSESIVTSLFGIDPGEAMFAEARGGNDFLNLLETTFLGPFVKFFRGPFADAIEGIGGFGGDIFSAIFGGGTGKATADQGVGTRVLNVLEQTFLGPITEFFRGPFADLVETIGGGIADFGGFLGDIFNALFGDDPGGVGTRILNVLEDTFLGPIVRFFRGPFSNGVSSVVGFIGDVIGTIADAIQAGLTLIEPLTDAIGRAIQGLFGGNDTEGKAMGPGGGGVNLGGIWDGLTSSLGNIVEEVGGALDPVWDAITGWFADTFSAANVIGVAKDVGNIIREVGRVIGLFVSDPRFIAALAVTAAALLAAIGAALLGVFEGIAANADEWGAILLDGLGVAFDFIKDEGPGLLADAIGAILSDPAIGLAVAVGALIIGTSTGRGLLTGLVGIFRNRTESAKLKNAVTAGIAQAGLGGAVTTGIAQTKLSADIPVRFRDQLRNVGRSIGSAVVGGLVAFEAGQLAGQSGSFGGLVLGLLTGGATGAAIGSTIAPGVGTAIGAVLGTAVAGLGALFGSQAREAEQAAEKVSTYVDALRDLSGIEIGQGISDLILNSLSEAGPDAFAAWGDALVNMADFDFVAFGDRLTEGISTPADEATRFLQGLADEAAALDDVGLTGAVFEDFIALVDDLGLTLDQVADLSGQDIIDLGITQGQIDLLTSGNNILGELGITEGDLVNIHGVLAGQSEVVAKALAQIGLDADLASTDVKKLNDTDVTRIKGAVGDVVTPLKDLKDAANDAQAALEDLLNIDSYGGSFQALADEFALGLPNVNEQILNALEGVAPEDQAAAIRQAVGPFRDSIADLFGQAVDEGLVTNGGEMDTFLNGLRQQIIDADLTPEAELLMLEAVNALDTPEARALVKEKASAVMLAVAAELGAAGTEGKGKFNAIGVQAADDVLAGAVAGAGGGTYPQAREIGTKIAGTIAEGITSSKAVANAITASVSGASTTKTRAKSPSSVGVTVDDSGVAEARNVTSKIVATLTAGVVQAARAASALGTAITSGIEGGASGAASAGARAAAASVSAVRVYSVAMHAAGANLTNAMAQGISSQASQAANAAANVAAIVAAAARAKLKIKSPSQVFFDIGTQIGQGFVAGIQDAEGDMAQAMGDAISNAIAKGTERAGDAMRKAQVGEAIFSALAPSLIPGGASQSAITLQAIQALQQSGALTGSFRSTAVSSLGSLTAGDAEKAQVGLGLAILQFQEAFQSIAQEWNDAWHLNAGTNNEGVAQPLSIRQQNILATGPAGLAQGTFAGSANREALASAIASITEWGRAALEAGVSAGGVTDTITAYVNALRNQAASLGFNVAQVDEVIAAYGLSTAALEEWRRGLTALDFSTEGLANNALILEQLESIREFGTQMLSAGQGADEVVANIRNLRNQLVAQATAFGFNATQIAALVEQVGLSDTALAAFIQQIRDFEAAAAGAAAALPGTNEQIQRPTIENLNLVLPYGDPEAVGLAVLNRVAFETLGG